MKYAGVETGISKLRPIIDIIVATLIHVQDSSTCKIIEILGTST